MNAELKRKWVKALRSGKYVQGKRRLKREVEGVCSYCCLGVLYDVSGGRWNCEDGHYRTHTQSDSYVDFAILPFGTQDVLSTMNDYKDKSFFEIADWIDANIPTEETP